ncbi:fumarylacetoacetate hydrolase family protein, partial [Streptomyces sp. NPDC005047]
PGEIPDQAADCPEPVPDSSTKEMIFGVAETVAYLSRYMTLHPGDVIATGTPHGVGMGRTPQLWLGDGDVVEVEVENVGRLRNTVRLTG